MLVAAAALSTGCAVPPALGTADTADPSAPPADPVPRSAEPVVGCPVPSEPAREPTGQTMIIDYVDFIRYDGREYLADPSGVPLDPGQVGEVVLESTCSADSYNAQTGQEPTSTGDGFTGFLPPGTPVHAVDGWSPQCRLGAEHNGRWTSYLALDPDAEFAQPASCAVR